MKDRDDDRKMTRWMRAGSFGLGVILIGAGIADAAFNPFSFITADKLLLAGTSLVAIGLTGKKEGGNDKQ